MAKKETPQANLRALLGREVDLVLLPGQIHLATTPTLVSTLLGSCVALVLHSPRRRITAISHAQLPEDKSKLRCSDLCPVQCLTQTAAGNRNKYVTCSTQNMLGKLAQLGIGKEDLEVKIFGGANVLSAYAPALAIGTQNVAIAHQLIAHHRLKLVGEDTGGDSGRTIYCYTDSSEVLVRRHVKTRRPDALGEALSPPIGEEKG